MGNKTSTSQSDSSVPSTSTSIASHNHHVTSTANTACQYCGIFASDADRHTQGYYTCKRCGGLLPYYKRTQFNDTQLSLQRLHILPFIETLPTAMQHCTETDLLQQYILPYFQHSRPYVTVNTRLQINGIDCKVVACHPPAGMVTPSTKIRAMGKYLSALNHITRLHVLPSKASVQSLPQNEQSQLTPELLFQKYIRSYFNNESHHVSVGDTFMSNGLQFKVVAASPDNGTVDSNTEIFTDGSYLDDVKKIHVLPVYESLPNNEKNIQAAESFERYIAPYFLGRMQYINRNDTLNIDGVQYKVLGCSPDTGIVTLETEIFADGQPLRAEDIRRRQEEEDARIARQMAQQDMSYGRRGQRGNDDRLYPMPLGGDPEELRMRMAEILRIMPNNDPYRPVVQRLHDQLTLLPFLPNGTVGLDPQMARIMQSAVAIQQPVNNGASQTQLDALPTRTYTKPTHKTNTTAAGGNQEEEDKDHTTCMVCLAEYDEGDELRTLPCFHTFHSNCIDMWLKRKGECPVCRFKLQ